ncbi:MAG: PAS domain-containing protein [Planctomycetota bacterium]
MTSATFVHCAWCNKPICASATDDSHGICLDCLPGTFSIPVESLAELSREQLDTLPYGIVVLDEHDRLLEYNDAESRLARRPRREVLGKGFFTEVAPYTNVEQLSGWVQNARRKGVSQQQRRSCSCSSSPSASVSCTSASRSMPTANT